MNQRMLSRFLLSASMSLLAAACATVSRFPPSSETTQPNPDGSSVEPQSYTPERDAGEVAQMRAAPAPESATITLVAAGSSGATEANRFANDGFVRIGTGRYRDSEARARDAVERQARTLGAERVLLTQTSAADDDSTWTASYYVRYRLALGATFRELRPAERETLGGGGVQIGAVVDGTPAARANLMSGDFVTQVNGRAIADKAAFQDALRANVGRNVNLTVVRNGETLKRIVRLGGGAPAANAH
jgi:hypothetical protein